MNKHSRRDFMVCSAAGTLALGTEKLFAREAPATRKPVDMAIARWTGSKNLTAGQIKRIAVKLTEKAIDGMGGLKRFIGTGDVVWVKPNMAWDRTPELAANTNPDVVATIVRLCFQAGAKIVKVGDNPCHLATKSYHNSGIASAVRKLGAKVVFLDRSRFRNTAIRGERIKSIPIYPEILDCDLVINVPVVKHHALAKLTMCMKNYLGVVENRQLFHQDLPTCIADITRFMKPRICVLDAVRVLTAHGPTGGNPADVQLKATVAAGTDIVALDALGAELMGKKPREIGTVVKGQQVGLGRMDYRSLSLREIAVS